MALSEAAQAAIDGARRRAIDRSVNPLLLDLPDWVAEYRSHQVEAIPRIVSSFEDGAKVVVVDAPTGSGKTLLAETVRRMMQVSRTLYVNPTKSLQEQFMRDFPYAKLLKGRANYPTLKESLWPEITADDCTWDNEEMWCQWCGPNKRTCPYECAKTDALKAPLSVLNTSYWLTECNGPGRFSGADLVIFDEADTLESALMSHVSVEVSPRTLKTMGMGVVKKVTVRESWKEWLDEAIPKTLDVLKSIPRNSMDIRVVRRRKYWGGLYEKLYAIRRGIDEAYWVYTGKEDRVSFKPSHVDEFGRELVWKHADCFMLMSATVISAAEMLDSLGYDGRYEVVRVPSTFDKRNRKVIVNPVADMSRAGGDASRGKMTHALSAVLARHPDDRVLVHTVSYDLANALAGSIVGRPVVTYNDAGSREDALARFISTPRAVCVAPSLDRGIDLRGDDCRVQVIVKVPYPYLGERQVSARLYGTRGGRVWYSVQTIRTIVQMTGRAVRSADDWAVTYILDQQFNRLWSSNRNLFPAWWVEALSWSRERLG